MSWRLAKMPTIERVGPKSDACGNGNKWAMG